MVRSDFLQGQQSFCNMSPALGVRRPEAACTVFLWVRLIPSPGLVQCNRADPGPPLVPCLTSLASPPLLLCLTSSLSKVYFSPCLAQCPYPNTFPHPSLFEQIVIICPLGWPPLPSLPCKHKDILRSYAGQEATVRTGHGTTDWFQIGKGVHQGCILSPCLFNLYTEHIMQSARLDEAQAGSRFLGEISMTSDMQMTLSLRQKVKGN